MRSTRRSRCRRLRRSGSAYSLRDGFGAGLWLGIPVTMVCQTALWWWSQHLLMGGRIRWLPLLPGAVLTAAAAVTALSVGARFYVPTDRRP